MWHKNMFNSYNIPMNNMDNVWEPGFMVGENREKFWEPGFRVGKIVQILGNRGFGWGKGVNIGNWGFGWREIGKY